MTDTKNDFSIGSVKGTIVRLALPMIAAQIINALYNVVDRIYIGWMPEVGRQALTGVGVSFPVIMIISAFAVLWGAGGAPLFAMARGRGDNDHAEHIMGNSFLMLILSGVIVTALGLAVKEPVLYLCGASSETFTYANEFLTVYLFGSVFVMITLGMNSFITAQGFAKIAMVTVAVGAITSIILDPIFIFALDMGVRGAALANVISQFISGVWVLCFITGRKTILKLRLACIKPNLSIIGKTAALGISNFIMSVTTSIVYIAVNASLKRYGGDVYVCAGTVISSLRDLLTLPVAGFSSGAQPFLSYNYGANKNERVQEGIKFTVLVCFIYCTITCIIAELFPGTLIRIFNSDAELLRVGIPALQIYFSMHWMMGLQMAGQSVFVALGRAKQAIIFATLRKMIIMLPLLLLLPGVFGLGVTGIFIAEPVSDFISASACILTMYFTVYRPLKTEVTGLERLSLL